MNEESVSPALTEGQVPAPGDEPSVRVNRLLDMDRDAVMEAAAERVCGPEGCPPGSVFDGKEDSLADAVHQAVAAALDKLGQLGYPVTFGPVSDRAGTAPTDEPPAGLPAALGSVDDVAAVAEAYRLRAAEPEDGKRGWCNDDASIAVGANLDGWSLAINGCMADFDYGFPTAVLVVTIQAARSAS